MCLCFLALTLSSSPYVSRSRISVQSFLRSFQPTCIIFFRCFSLLNVIRFIFFSPVSSSVFPFFVVSFPYLLSFSTLLPVSLRCIPVCILHHSSLTTFLLCLIIRRCPRNSSPPELRGLNDIVSPHSPVHDGAVLSLEVGLRQLLVHVDSDARVQQPHRPRVSHQLAIRKLAPGVHHCNDPPLDV